MSSGSSAERERVPPDIEIATLDDFAVLLSSELENLAPVIRAESPPY